MTHLPNIKLSAPTRSSDSIAGMEEFDSYLRTWALLLGCDERQFPVLIDSAVLETAEYPAAFPHLLMAAAVAKNPEIKLAQPNLALTDWHLSPAVCYHAFAELAGTVIHSNAMLTARGHCFRNEVESERSHGRRQVEFQMRELILLGQPSWLDEQLARIQSDVDSLARDQGLETTWCPATDPFFLPKARGKAQIQRLLGTKIELCLPCGLAVASINRHGTFFGDRFDITLAGGDAVHSACVALGLDRWIAHAQPLCL
jgi:seryl-tRNA synthetase